jgi:hypothetical protein
VGPFSFPAALPENAVGEFTRSSSGMAMDLVSLGDSSRPGYWMLERTFRFNR